MAAPDSPAQPAPRSAPTPVLSVSFTRDALIIQGEQFAPGERVRVYLAAMPSAGFEQFVLLGETTADARGALVLTAGLPMRHMPKGNGGMAHVIAQGSVTGFTAFAGVAVPVAVSAGGGEPATPAPTETPLPPPPTSTPEPIGEWFAEYYANRDLGGPPVLTRMEETRCDARHQWLCLNWGRASAGDGMPADQWSATFTRTITLDTLDNYIFELWVDDGARVYLDGQLIINEWRQGRWRAAYGFTVRGPGEHTLRVDYFDAAGAARVKLSWWAGYTAWEARYYNSTYLDGPVILKRDDHDINFTDKPGEGPLWPPRVSEKPCKRLRTMRSHEKAESRTDRSCGRSDGRGSDNSPGGRSADGGDGRVDEDELQDTRGYPG